MFPSHLTSIACLVGTNEVQPINRSNGPTWLKETCSPWHAGLLKEHCSCVRADFFFFQNRYQHILRWHWVVINAFWSEVGGGCGRGNKFLFSFTVKKSKKMRVYCSRTLPGGMEELLGFSRRIFLYLKTCYKSLLESGFTATEKGEGKREQSFTDYNEKSCIFHRLSDDGSKRQLERNMKQCVPKHTSQLHAVAGIHLFTGGCNPDGDKMCC